MTGASTSRHCLVSSSWQHAADSCSRFHREENQGSERKRLSGHDPAVSVWLLKQALKTALLTRTCVRFPISLLSVVLNQGCTFEIPGILFRRLWLGPSQTNQINLWEWTQVEKLGSRTCLVFYQEPQADPELQRELDGGRGRSEGWLILLPLTFPSISFFSSPPRELASSLCLDLRSFGTGVKISVWPLPHTVPQKPGA